MTFYCVKFICILLAVLFNASLHLYAMRFTTMVGEESGRKERLNEEIQKGTTNWKEAQGSRLSDEEEGWVSWMHLLALV